MQVSWFLVLVLVSLGEEVGGMGEMEGGTGCGRLEE